MERLATMFLIVMHKQPVLLEMSYDNEMNELPANPAEKSCVWLGSVISSVIESKEILEDAPITEPIIDLRINQSINESTNPWNNE